VADAPPPALARECQALCRYLTGRGADEYVASRYAAGHAAIPYRCGLPPDAFDVFLVLSARGGSFRARMADAYARVFRPGGMLRQKLTLLLAILENAPATHHEFTRGGRGRFRAFLGIGGSLAGFALAFLLGMLSLGLIHLMLRGRQAPVTR